MTINYHRLQCKPGITHAFDVEKGHMCVCVRFVQHPRCAAISCSYGEVLDDRNPKIRMGFQAKGQDRYADEKH